MNRKIIKINEEKCNGCGICVNACHEGALELVNGKARLTTESYCDGLGACLPECPTGAISIEEREAEAFIQTQTSNDKNIEKHVKIEHAVKPAKLACGCSGTEVKSINLNTKSQLRQWPCQMKLLPVNAPYFNNANLLIAADCTAYAYANFHEDFMKNKITIIGCPKLDNTDYSEKLGEILKNNSIKSITVLRMQVPCCGGLVVSVKNALIKSEKMIPWHVITLSSDGNIVEE